MIWIWVVIAFLLGLTCGLAYLTPTLNRSTDTILRLTNELNRTTDILRRHR